MPQGYSYSHHGLEIKRHFKKIFIPRDEPKVFPPLDLNLNYFFFFFFTCMSDFQETQKETKSYKKDNHVHVNQPLRKNDRYPVSRRTKPHPSLRQEITFKEEERNPLLGFSSGTSVE